MSYTSLEHIIRNIITEKNKENLYKKKQVLPPKDRPDPKEKMSDFDPRVDLNPKNIKEDELEEVEIEIEESIGEVGKSTYEGPEFTTRQTMPLRIRNKGRNEGPKKVANARNVAQTKRSSTMAGRVANEEVVDEGLIDTAARFVLAPLAQLVKNLPAVIKQTVKGVTKKTELPAPQKVPQLAPPKVNLPSTSTKAEIPFSTPKAPTTTPAPAPQTQTLPQVAPKTQTLPKVAAPVAPATTTVVPRPQTPTEVKPELKPETKTPELTKPAETSKPAEAPKTEVKPAEKTPVGEPPAKPPASGGKSRIFPIPFPKGSLAGSLSPDSFYTQDRIHNKVVVHKAKAGKAIKEDRTNIEAVPRSGTPRKELQYVGRNNDKPRTEVDTMLRKNEIFRKIVEESKKTAKVVKRVKTENGGQTRVYPNVIINPDLKHADLNVDDGIPTK